MYKEMYYLTNGDPSSGLQVRYSEQIKVPRTQAASPLCSAILKMLTLSTSCSLGGYQTK